MRADGRTAEQMRPLKITPDFISTAEGSVLIELGNTRVICTATVDDGVPSFLKGSGKGWITSEYGMLPRATEERTPREAARGKQSGRTLEIQRLIGRSLRSVTDQEALGERTVWLDCDVIQADGGTRTASITGAFVALALAFERLVAAGILKSSPLIDSVAATSVGIVDDRALLDLAYEEDSRAEVDMNVVMTGGGHFVEIQATAEGRAFSGSEMQDLLALAAAGIRRLTEEQRAILDAESLPAFEESAPTFAENAAGKALHYSRLQEGLVFADDSGLVVPALSGAPGVHSARYAGADATNSQRIEKLLGELRGKTGEERSAHFVCAIALAKRGRAVAIVTDRADGQVLEAPRGSGGFGYDPVFYFPAARETFAELSAEEKNRHSHRGKAFRKLLAVLSSML